MIFWECLKRRSSWAKRLPKFPSLIEFTIEVAPNVPVIEATKIPLTQILSNLITNAIKHHHQPDGTVKILARELDGAYEFSVSLLQTNICR